MQELERRGNRLEDESDKLKEAVTQLLISTEKLNDVVAKQNEFTPKIASLNERLHALELDISNARLVQSAFVKVVVIIAGSAITMAVSAFAGVI